MLKYYLPFTLGNDVPTTLSYDLKDLEHGWKNKFGKLLQCEMHTYCI